VLECSEQHTSYLCQPWQSTPKKTAWLATDKVWISRESPLWLCLHGNFAEADAAYMIGEPGEFGPVYAIALLFFLFKQRYH
jgi:hypothetical protein